ncbi:MAG: HAMP domain-containing protein [Sandaracinus sp.]|nr:HAMP domain-containing protein [Sandaracinus sp.]MCB9618129.1 HAMP domain-containing protein [Sandaracinus sp.]
MSRLSRFERRILGAMTFSALATLIGALVLGRAALFDAYRVGVNPAVRARLDEGVESHRAHLDTLRREAETIADAIAFHRSFPGAGTPTAPFDAPSPDEDPEPEGFGGFDEDLEALDEPAQDAPTEAHPELDAVERYFHDALTRYPSVGALALYEDGVESLRVEETSRLDPERARPVTLFRPLGERRRLEVVATAPAELFAALQAAGEEAELYTRLDARAELVSGTYAWVYLAFLLLVIVAALVIAAVLARRVTGRVTTLAVAVRKVGAGDLTVHVPTEGNDEIRELTRAFNGMVRDLRDSRARIDYLQRIGAWQEFARRLAHEIKNPLTPIQLAAQEMHRSYKGDDPKYLRKLEDACAIIEEEVETLRRLVSEFSNFAKLPRADLSPADLRDFVRDLQRGVAAILEDVGAAGGRAAEVEIVTPDDAMPVRIDAMMLKRCTDNLVRNALQALRGRERGGHVRVEARTHEEGFELRVEDDGPGVPEKDRETVFDPYFTTKSDGTGLGLAIVKKVVLEHGGEIRCEASELGGAAFVIRLPRAE